MAQSVHRSGSAGWLVGHNFLKGREVTLPRFYWNTCSATFTYYLPTFGAASVAPPSEAPEEAVVEAAHPASCRSLICLFRPLLVGAT